MRSAKVISFEFGRQAIGDIRSAAFREEALKAFTDYQADEMETNFYGLQMDGIVARCQIAPVYKGKGSFYMSGTVNGLPVDIEFHADASKTDDSAYTGFINGQQVMANRYFLSGFLNLVRQCLELPDKMQGPLKSQAVVNFADLKS